MKRCSPDLGDLETPALLLDEARFTANAQRMDDRAAALGVLLRPHVKTLKSLDAAALYAPRSCRITVSTLREAEQFAAAGYRDILYSVGIAPNKLERAAALIRSGVDLTFFIDTVAAAQRLAQAARSLNVRFSAMIEIDVDGHRAGIPADGDELLAIAAALTRGHHAVLRGVAAHAGSSYACRSLEAIADLAERERSQTVRAAQRLREAGWPIADVSVGSTPTALCARNLSGVTELRAGVYATFDLVMARLGVCVIADIALSVLCTVIGQQCDRHWLLVDAGWMAMSRDLGAADQGYGLVCDIDGMPLDDLILHDVNQEQGIIRRRDGAAFDLEAFPYGRMLRILPNHACATAAQFERYHVLNDRRVTAIWPRDNAW